MNLLHFDDYENTPATLEGMAFKEEQKLLYSACEFTSSMGSSLHCSPEVVGSANIYIHKYSRLHPVRKFDRFKLGAVCLFLSSKVLNRSTSGGLEMVVKWYCFHEGKSKGETPSGPPSHQRMHKLKEEFGVLELEVLECMGYNVEVEVPYKYITEYTNYPTPVEFPKTKVMQYASIFVNDALKSPLPLFFHPLLIAIACLDMGQCYVRSQSAGGRECRFGLLGGREWINYLHPGVLPQHVSVIVSIIKGLYGDKGEEGDEGDAVGDSACGETCGNIRNKREECKSGNIGINESGVGKCKPDEHSLIFTPDRVEIDTSSAHQGGALQPIKGGTPHNIPHNHNPTLLHYTSYRDMTDSKRGAEIAVNVKSSGLPNKLKHSETYTLLNSDIGKLNKPIEDHNNTFNENHSDREDFVEIIEIAEDMVNMV